MYLDPSRSDVTIGDEDRPLSVEDYTPLLKERQEQWDALVQSQQRSMINLFITTSCNRFFARKSLYSNIPLSGPGWAGAMVSCSLPGRAIQVRWPVPATRDDCGDRCTQTTKVQVVTDPP